MRLRSSRGRERIAGVGGRVEVSCLSGAVTSIFVDCRNTTSAICIETRMGHESEPVLEEAWDVHSHSGSFHITTKTVACH